MELKTCQPGVEEWNLPAWCVEQETGVNFWLQGFIEIIVVIILFILLRYTFGKLKGAYRRWKRRKEPLSKWKQPF